MAVQYDGSVVLAADSRTTTDRAHHTSQLGLTVRVPARFDHNHHSLPIWAAKYGGWRDERKRGYFIDFTRMAVDHFADLVDSWITLMNLKYFP